MIRLAALALSLLFSTAQAQEIITTVAGGGPNNLPAAAANVAHPVSVAVDSAGNRYIAAQQQNRVFKVDTAGQLTVVAGNGTLGFSGDGGPATAAALAGPSGVALDGSGNLYIADTFNNLIRRVDTSGIIATVAGSGTPGFSGDGGPATAAELSFPDGVAVDGSGNLYIADTSNSRVRRVSSGGIITTVAGKGNFDFSGDGGPAADASLFAPFDVALDATGNLYIADAGNGRVRRVDMAGIITTVAGNGDLIPSGDGGPATAAGIGFPTGVVLDGGGNLYIADPFDSLIRRVDTGGTITTVAGNGTPGFSGDGGAATAASLNEPNDVATDGNGNLYLADTFNNRLRQVSPGGVITTLAGNGTFGFSGDGHPATGASLEMPDGVAIDGGGNLYITDRLNSRIRRVDSTGTITTVAGNGEFGFSGDGGPATAASLALPFGVAVDGSGNLYIADEENNRVRRVDSTGTITTVAGNGTAGFGGDGGPATAASLNAPFGVAVDGSGNLYIADTFNDRIRRVTPGGIITTVAGNGTTGFSGDGGPATAASLNAPFGVAVDGSGNLYIADEINDRVRRVDTSGIITTVAGNGTPGFSGDGGPATDASLQAPFGIAAGSDGSLYIADLINNRVRRVDPAGIIATVAGNGDFGFSGDGGPATAASLAFPTSVAVDGSGILYIADENNDRVRRVGPGGSTPLSINLVVPSEGASYPLGATVHAQYSCSGSGLASCTGTVPSGSPIDTASVGAKTFTVTAADNAGNTAVASRNYTVVYRFSGFFAPVRNPPALNRAEAGSTIPLRFGLGVNQGPSILAPGAPTSRRIPCTEPPAGGEGGQAAAGSLAHGSGAYVFRWKTRKAWAGTCRQFDLRLIDGTSHVANFRFR